MDNARFSKLAKECGLVSRDCSTTDVDIIFSQIKDKGARKITLSQFRRGLVKIGEY